SAGVPALNFSNVSNGNIQIKTAVNNSNLTSSTARANVIGLGFYGLGVAPLSVANLSYVSSCNSTSTVYFSNNTVVYPFNESTCPEFSANRSLVVTVTDTAGNSNSTTFGFLVDNVEPSLAVWSPTDGQYFTNVNVSINFSVRDKDNSISSVGYYLDNSPFVTAIINSSAMGGSAGQGVNESDSRLLNFTPGTHTIKLTANDSLGNVINGSDLIFTITGPFNFTGYINDSLRVINNISIVNLTNSTGHTINFDAGSLKNTEDETWNLIMKLNSSAGTANVTIVFNASAANWDKNFSIAINDSKLKRDINNNYTASIQELISFNSSIQSFLSNNNSYYGVVTYKINASNATYSAPIGGSLEIWYFPDLGDLTSKTNITECSAGFSPSLSTALSAGTFPCWNNTNNISINIYVPHFSGIAIVNDSNAPAVNVSMPSDANQSTSMFVPNITVSSDTDSCLSSVNGTVANVTMTKSGTTCMGQTERFTNLNAPNGGYNFTFSVTDGNGNVNQYVWKFNVTDATTPNNGIITSSPSTISSTVTITGTNESVNATVNYGTVNTTLGSSAVQTDFNETQIVTISGLSESTTYHYNVTVCDFAGNCKTNSTVFSFATSAAAAAAASTTTSSSSGGGGGGAAAPTTEVASASRSWDSLAADSTGTFKISSSSIAFTNIVIAVVSTVSNPTVGVSSLTSNPQSSAPSSIVYQYLKITHSNIADSDISSATISFKVPKSWLTTNNVAEGDIVLYRFNSGQWNALPTTITGSDADNVWFEAVTPGFSDYAIGSKAGAPTTPVTTEQPAPSTQPVAPATPAATGQPSQSTQPDGTKPVRNNNLAWIVVAIIVIVAALCFVIWQKKKSQQ
ncbi:MAG TPA: PGF-pre-PGF domain-containing protein, partial [Candidatus Nanoarchaeia archaeon]|nr:PGF-pre-PGF domain-containing protein [Candidatus Nanoarchaeia archaeon]